MNEAQPGILGPVARPARYLTFSLVDVKNGRLDLKAPGL